MLNEISKSALDAIREQVGDNRRIAFVSGNFNVIHPGHLRLLKFAADCADFLVVAVNAGGAEEELLDQDLRLAGIQAVSLVNFAFLLDDNLKDFICALKPAVVIKGQEFESRTNVEKEAVDSYGGTLLFSSGDVKFSSLDLLKREFRDFNASTIRLPMDYPKRHGFDMADIRAALARLSGVRVLVLGDLIVDEYIECDPLGMSQEDPTLVVSPILTETFVGGAGIVASHARGLGGETRFLSIANRDAAADFAAERLASYGVDARVLTDSSRPTTLKQRFRAKGKTLLRVSHLKQHWIDKSLQEQILAEVKVSLAATDLVVFSDFNYGCLPQALVDAIVEACRERNVPMAADSQSSSQTGDVSRFRNMMLTKPTEREARLALQDFRSGLITVLEKLRKKTSTDYIVATLGAEGLIAHVNNADIGWQDDRLPAFNASPKDTAGAGDSLLITTALALVSGSNIWQSVYLGSVAAACQVGRTGNLPLAVADLERELRDEGAIPWPQY